MPPLLLCIETGEVVKRDDAAELAITLEMDANIYPVWMNGIYVGYMNGSMMVTKTVRLHGKAQFLFDQENGTARPARARDKHLIRNYGEYTMITSDTYPLYSNGYYIGYVKDGHIHRIMPERTASRNARKTQP